jgi:acylaminoacyl-peptidase
MGKSKAILPVMLWLIVALCSPASKGQEKKELLSPLDIFELEIVSDPQISPDGTRVAYVRQNSDVMTDRRYTNIWVINIDGTGHRPLTSEKYHNGSPRWATDGSQLIFISNRQGRPQIFKRWMDTGQTEVLTNPMWASSRPQPC